MLQWRRNNHFLAAPHVEAILTLNVFHLFSFKFNNYFHIKFSFRLKSLQ